jgi:CAAX prenyl protease-like protein
VEWKQPPGGRRQPEWQQANNKNGNPEVQQITLMNPLQSRMRESAVFARVAPFAVFLLLTVVQEYCGEAGRYWLYFAKTLVGAWMIWMARPFLREMRWALSWESIAVGVAVFGLWVGLDRLYPQLGTRPSPEALWNPHRFFGAGSAMAWFFILVRIVGTATVVPMIEEVFYRSFLYRYIVNPRFETVALNHFAPFPFLISAAIFGLAHAQWLPGILCGALYQWLVWRKARLGDAMTAHGITNLLLGLWVAWRGAWGFW